MGNGLGKKKEKDSRRSIASPIADDMHEAERAAMDAVLAVLQPQAPGQERRLLDGDVHVIYEKATGEAVDHRFRIERPFRFKNVIVCGQNVFGKTVVKGAVIDSKFVKDVYTASCTVLPTHKEWQSMATRPKLVIEWVRKVILAFTMVIDESPTEIARSMPRFSNDYHRPTAELKDESTIAMFLWARMGEDKDEDPDNTYRRLGFVCTSDGRVSPPKVLATKVVPIKDRNLVH